VVLVALVARLGVGILDRPYWVGHFVPDPAALDTLIDARHRGVDVRIMVSGRHNDNWLSRRNAVRMYGRLLEAGVEILEYEPTLCGGERG
jgi:phosphatidylserine/phosphatidylglycerophosphate/cardiolipin synthase-like enzyme